MKTSSFLTPQDFQEKVSELGAIHHIDYELTTIAIPEGDTTPAPDFVSRQRIKVFYERRFQGSSLLKQHINSFLERNFDKIKRLFLKGKDADGEEIHYSIADDPSVFHEYEFDDFAVELDIDESAELSLVECDNIISLVSLSRQATVSDFFYTQVQP